MFSVCIDLPKGPSYYPKNIMLQFYIFYYKKYYATWMLLEKLCYMKTNISFGDPVIDPSQSFGSRTLFYTISIMPKIFIEDSSNLKHSKNVKSINNTTSSYLVSCRVISSPATMKRREKDVFWKIQALGNLKCTKSKNLKSS